MLNYINFFIDNQKITMKNHIKFFLKFMLKNEGITKYKINYIFCKKSYILFLNKKYLHNKNNTDSLTFVYKIEKRKIISDIYLNIEKIRFNSLLYKCQFIIEVVRNLIHGLLHSIGYLDNNHIFKYKFKKKENYYLDIYKAYVS
ncbi:MAG: rRNA maturation RNase YbeY [Candidatus Shikimatogenerans sp. AspAUS03]|uniref:rRNA maturation RNase YbeY n=1 Tax=Candidatus Shikimatogenerans sp. AspAUS03 TaxID=3158563 RepID=A0AAU7QSY4_9FLAO